jgi:hypothetical protein
MFLTSSKEGRIVRYIPITKKTLPVDRYSECSHWGQAVLSSCRVLGIKTMKSIKATPASWNEWTMNLLASIFSLSVIKMC